MNSKNRIKPAPRHSKKEHLRKRALVDELSRQLDMNCKLNQKKSTSGTASGTTLETGSEMAPQIKTSGPDDDGDDDVKKERIKKSLNELQTIVGTFDKLTFNYYFDILHNLDIKLQNETISFSDIEKFIEVEQGFQVLGKRSKGRAKKKFGLFDLNNNKYFYFVFENIYTSSTEQKKEKYDEFNYKFKEIYIGNVLRVLNPMCDNFVCPLYIAKIENNFFMEIKEKYDISLFKYVENEVTTHKLDNRLRLYMCFVLQMLYAFKCADVNLSFRHGDPHFDNFLISTKEETRTLIFDDKHKFTFTGPVLKIIDFDNSSIDIETPQNNKYLIQMNK